MTKYFAYYDNGIVEQIWIRNYITRQEKCIYNHYRGYLLDTTLDYWLNFAYPTIDGERMYQQGFENIKLIRKKDVKRLIFMASL